jgi:hypothetical protein
MFTGDVYFDVIAKGEEPSRLRVNPRLRGESTGRRALNP